jgi:hypothetical protein
MIPTPVCCGFLKFSSSERRHRQQIDLLARDPYITSVGKTAE